MKDSPILLIFLIIYLIAASSGRKRNGAKKKPQMKSFLGQEAERRRSSQRTHARGEQEGWRSTLRARQAQQGFHEAFDAHGPEERDCESQPIHLHDVGQAQMTLAGEGEDPCHAGGRGAEPSEAAAAVPGETHSALAQDVLRGVIMSEILTRPHERTAQYAARRRKGYHG